MLIQFNDHFKDVVALFPDIGQSHIIHSASQDRSICTYDLKKEAKINGHQTKNGALFAMSQRKDSELELGNTLSLTVQCLVDKELLSISGTVMKLTQLGRLSIRTKCLHLRSLHLGSLQRMGRRLMKCLYIPYRVQVNLLKLGRELGILAQSQSQHGLQTRSKL